MEVTKALMQDHVLILGYIDSLLNYCNKAQALDDAEIYIDFIENFSDKYHHAKEEDILFSYLSRPGVLEHCNPVPQMLYEHDLGRQLTAALKEAVRERNLSGFLSSAREYSDLLRQHIHKEDRILYGMAEESLSDSLKVEIQDKYRLADEQHNGPALRMKFEGLLSTLG